MFFQQLVGFDPDFLTLFFRDPQSKLSPAKRFISNAIHSLKFSRFTTNSFCFIDILERFGPVLADASDFLDNFF